MVMCMLGPAQIVLLAALALIVFGPKRLPEIGRSLGHALREFQRASSEFMEAINHPAEEQEHAPPPVKSIEYPPVTAAMGTEQYQALPYGSDFASGASSDLHSEPTVSPMEDPAVAAPAGEVPSHPEMSAGTGASDAGSPERKS